ncbi:MAG TPA: Hpt domain-containing protein [Bacteroidales bacterium]|nr:Hpt domain-containing protein [Bacteroidales bacterium]
MKTKGKYYNIEKLIHNTKGNSDFIKNLIDIFISKNSISVFEDLLEKKEFDKLSEQLHKIKSNLPYLASPEIADKVSKVYLLSLHKKYKKLTKDLPEVIVDLKNLVNELNEDFC